MNFAVALVGEEEQTGGAVEQVEEQELGEQSCLSAAVSTAR